MSNTLKSFDQSNILSTVSKTISNDTPGVPEIYGYNVIYDQDHDILNQGSVEHIQKYFDNKQKEAEAKRSIVDAAINGPAAHLTQDVTLTGLGDNTYMSHRHVSPVKKSSDYSINNMSFMIKFILFIIFVWIMWDFIDGK